MLKREDFKNVSNEVIDWIENYFQNLKSFPVKSQVIPKAVYNKIPASIPAEGVSFTEILQDTSELIIPGITHWQHPNFHAYFPANNSLESIFAEMITATIGAQCMIWDTSPAAAELEQRMLEWMRDAMGLPKEWEGVIQDTASTATLVALICAREKSTNFQSNEMGVPPNLRIYCSSQTHSSIEKGAVIAGFGRRNVIKIGADSDLTLSPIKLENQIRKDLSSQHIPSCVIATIGTTGTVAFDDLPAISKICIKYKIWFHIDAAYAGTALFLPEYQWLMKGGENADSFVFNPHKWMFTNFDCTAYYVKDADHLIKTFEILPEYLKSKTRGKVNDYRDWGIPLGRRFRALKLWFVMRSFGLSGIQLKLRQHIELNEYFAGEIEKHDCIELIQTPFLNFSCFRVTSNTEKDSTEQSNLRNQELIENINNSGQAFLSHTVVNSKIVIRVVIGQTYVEKKDIDKLIQLILENVNRLIEK